MKEFMEWVRDLLLAVVIAAILMIFFKPILIQQTSMEPNFHSKDYVIISRQAYKLFGDIERGDVIVFKTELENEKNGKNKNLIKRVIALPGDTVEIVDGYVYVNDEKIDEPYVIEQGTSGDLEKLTVEEGKVFAMGDNRPVSLDSRIIGTIDQDDIMGRVVIRLYPFNNIKTF